MAVPEILKSRFVKLGIPFLTLIVGGSFGLKYFAELRYTFRKGNALTHEDMKKIGVKMKEEKPTLESEYKKIQEMDIDNWNNIRGPRPWEDSKSVQNEQRQQNSL